MRKDNCCSISLQCDLEAVSPGNAWTGERSSRDECARPLQPWSRAAFLLRPESPLQDWACCMSQRELVLRTNLSDLLRAYSDLDAAIAHLTIAAGIFAGIGADAGELQPEIWKRTEW